MQRVVIGDYWPFDLLAGFGELHFGAHTNPPPTELPRRVLLLLLRLHRCTEVFLLPRSNAHR